MLPTPRFLLCSVNMTQAKIATTAPKIPMKIASLIVLPGQMICSTSILLMTMRKASQIRIWHRPMMAPNLRRGRRQLIRRGRRVISLPHRRRPRRRRSHRAVPLVSPQTVARLTLSQATRAKMSSTRARAILPGLRVPSQSRQVNMVAAGPWPTCITNTKIPCAAPPTPLSWGQYRRGRARRTRTVTARATETSTTTSAACRIIAMDVLRFEKARAASYPPTT